MWPSPSFVCCFISLSMSKYNQITFYVQTPWCKPSGVYQPNHLGLYCGKIGRYRISTIYTSNNRIQHLIVDKHGAKVGENLKSSEINGSYNVEPLGMVACKNDAYSYSHWGSQPTCNWGARIVDLLKVDNPPFRESRGPGHILTYLLHKSSHTAFI